MNTVTLQFCSFGSLMGRVIEWFTQGDVGHVDVVLPDGTLLGAQDEAGLGGKPSGVQIRPPNYGGMTHIVRVEIPCNDAAAGLAFARAQIGKPYDVTAIEAFVADRDWRNPAAWFCSELAAATLEQAGAFPHPLASPANRITPAALLLVCSALAPVEG